MGQREYDGEDDAFGLNIFGNAWFRIKLDEHDERFQAYVEHGVDSKAPGNSTAARQAWMQYNWNNGNIRVT